MSSILVIAEHLEGKLKGATLNAVTFANQAAELAGHDVIGVVLGSSAGAAATELANHVPKVISIDGDAFKNYLAETYTPVIAALAEEFDAEIICAGSTTTGKDYLPRVCAALEGGFVSDVIEVYNDADEDQLAYKRPIWAGNLIERVTSDADVTCATIRTTAFDDSAGGVGGSVETRTGGEAPANAEFLRFHLVESNRPDLTDADVIVAGGRGLKSADAFGMIEALADKLGGAVGASRAAVDSGYAPNDWQIGQTGKIVAPNLYIAAAISGAIQHLAGMKGSKVIVAINKDPEAPIFQVSDYGLVADAFKAVPELTEKL
ncbi:MAG: electron transfer flavoprotein alpha subunit [Bradymonadia bacterium]|jgi:electron transfer flavoprotein alpha subunit